MLRLALAGLRRWPVSDEKIGFEYKLKRFLEGCLMPPEQAHVYWNGTFSEAQKRAARLAGFPARSMAFWASCGRRCRETASLPISGSTRSTILPDDILTKVDRMSMAHAVEVRPPFLDHRIVEFAASLPASFKIHGSRQKFILKELMKDKLPPPFCTRKKIGFDIPAHEWLRGPLRSLADRYLARPACSEHPGLFPASGDRGLLAAVIWKDEQILDITYGA